MSTFVLYTKPTFRTGKKLAEALGAECGLELPRKYTRFDRLLRWGASHAAYADADFSGVLDRAKRITKISNRHHMFQAINRVNPEHTLNFGYGPSALHHTTIVLRSRFGRWGKDIRIVNNDDLYQMDSAELERMNDEGIFSVQQWLGDFEVRVHVIQNTCVCMQIKRQEDCEENVAKREWFIRNRQNNWHLYPLSNPEATRLHINKRQLREAAKNVIAGCGLDFGVVDFLVRCGGTASEFNYRILEVNTAPGLEDSTLERYVTRLEAITPVEGLDEVPIPEPRYAEDNDYAPEEVEYAPVRPSVPGQDVVYHFDQVVSEPMPSPVSGGTASGRMVLAEDGSGFVDPDRNGGQVHTPSMHTTRSPRERGLFSAQQLHQQGFNTTPIDTEGS